MEFAALREAEDGPSRHFAALLNLGVVGSIADIEPAKLDLYAP
jgi:hypothetical protein